MPTGSATSAFVNTLPYCVKQFGPFDVILQATSKVKVLTAIIPYKSRTMTFTLLNVPASVGVPLTVAPLLYIPGGNPVIVQL
jgi:hypothetical protein